MFLNFVLRFLDFRWGPREFFLVFSVLKNVTNLTSKKKRQNAGGKNSEKTLLCARMDSMSTF